MAYNTGNPVGSDDPRDLEDNSTNFDKFSLGQDDAFADRLGEQRKSVRGMEREFDSSQVQRDSDFASVQEVREVEFQYDQSQREIRFNQQIIASGYANKGDYQAGIVLADYFDVFRKDGEFYRLSPAFNPPYTLTGNWAAESSRFIATGDATIRQELASTGGSAKVEFAGRNVQQKLADEVSAMDSPFGAAGNGVINDTAAFVALEAQYRGRLIDLAGRKFVVDSIPNNNSYYNGSFKVGGFTKPAVLAAGYDTRPPHFHKFGGQLANLFQGLSNPLEQITSVVFAGDSQTWGSGNTGEQGATDPRDGTMSDARDVFGTSSYVNIVKRYIGARFAKGVTPVLSNHPTSPSGESIATYTVPFILYPYKGDFTDAQSAGASMSISESFSTGIASGAQLRLSSGNAGVESSHSITFKFTGTTFTLGFGCADVDATYYEIISNGVSQGVFSTHAGVDGFVDGTNNNYRTHTIPYIRDKIVEIRTRRNGETGIRTLRLETLRIDKIIRLTNNGINGAAAWSYRILNLIGTPADGFAILPQDNHAVIKFGTNDRLYALGRPRGSNFFKNSLSQLLDAVVALSPGINIIMACSNPATDENTTQFSFTMQEVRNVIFQTSKARSLDMLDTYAVFAPVTLQPGFSNDGLHLNQLGYTLEARNFINSLESA